jgi:FkbM family methyltransferase
MTAAPALPGTLRAAAAARRLLGQRGTRVVYQSVLASRVRKLLSSAAPGGLSLVEVCGGSLAGSHMYIDLSCEKYYWLGTHETAMQDALCAHVRPDTVAYDVGAHAGFFTLLMSRLAGAGGRVLAFEPQPANAARLVANVDINGCRNVEVHAVALGDRNATLQFASGASSLQGMLAEDVGAAANQAVPVTTVDSLVSDGAKPPGLMKIDVEGAEGRVIAGAHATITAHRPLMLIEIHSPAAWGAVRSALPVPYDFIDVEPTRYAAALRMPGHYLGTPAAT